MSELGAWSALMKSDWDGRAREDAKWYINTFRRDQSDAEFFAQGVGEVEGLVKAELDLLCDGRDSKTLRLLEIGCGMGRMTRHMAPLFREIVATDVSAEMVRRFAEHQAHLPNVRAVETSGYDFAAFPNDCFDVIFSAYVYQHVPSAAVIRSNLTDAFRVLRPGGVFHFFTNGADVKERDVGDTWAGALFPEASVRALAESVGAQLLSVRGAGYQYLSVYWRKPNARVPAAAPPVIRAAAELSEAERAARMRACDDASVWLDVEGLSPDLDDANNVVCELSGVAVKPCYVGPVRQGVRRIELGVPPEIPRQKHTLVIRTVAGASAPWDIELSLERKRPIILLVTNDTDGGVDVWRNGEKASIRVFVTMPRKTDLGAVRLLVDGAELPARVEFLELHGYFMLRSSLPSGVGDLASVVVRNGEAESPAFPCKVYEPS